MGRTFGVKQEKSCMNQRKVTVMKEGGGGGGG